jgi:3-methyladenine DNA glycosylase AlkC
MVAKKSSTGFSLKDHLFNRERVEYLANLFSSADRGFDASGFVSETLDGFSSLELKQRIVKIATTLETYLADDFKRAAQQIVAALPPPLDPQRSDDDFGDFIFAPLGEYVVRRGSAPRHHRVSLKTLKQLTMRFSMEDAIRHFIRADPDQTLAELGKWATDKNYHVRRLVSEGTRPLLPWSGRLALPVERPLEFLDILHADNTRYVTRSVANHLNDIAKTEPELVLATLRRWQTLSQQSESELQWITRHALRTLIKQGHPAALKLLGFRHAPAIAVSDFALAQTAIGPGGAIEFSFRVNGSSPRVADARLRHRLRKSQRPARPQSFQAQAG